MNKILREPLFYFLLLGAAFFGLFQQVSDGGANPDGLEEIVITEGQVDALLVNFEKVWQRLPTSRSLMA